MMQQNVGQRPCPEQENPDRSTKSTIIRKYLKFFLFIDTFLCAPKEKYPKEKAPCAPLLPALLEPAGPLPNSAPRFSSGAPQTAEGADPSGSCDARRGTMGGRHLTLSSFDPS
jgi:hypothetical protein